MNIGKTFVRSLPKERCRGVETGYKELLRSSELLINWDNVSVTLVQLLYPRSPGLSQPSRGGNCIIDT